MAKANVYHRVYDPPTIRSVLAEDARRLALRTYGSLFPRSAAAWLQKRMITPTPRIMPETAYSFFTDNHIRRIQYGSRELCTWTWDNRTGGEGPTVLMMHGWSGRAGQFQKFIRPLLEEGFRVVTYDAPAHGFSTGEQTNLIDFAGAMMCLNEAYGPLDTLVAHSFAAPAAALALHYGVAVRKLVFLAPTISVGLYARSHVENFEMPAEVTPFLQTRLEKLFDQPLEHLCTDALLADRPSSDPVPLLVLHDAGDTEVPWQHGADIVRATPGAELITTRGLDHNKMMSDWGLIDDVIDFLHTP